MLTLHFNLNGWPLNYDGIMSKIFDRVDQSDSRFQSAMITLLPNYPTPEMVIQIHDVGLLRVYTFNQHLSR
jgi:hypothetical protein